MGELKRLRGNEYVYTIRDFRQGVVSAGPTGTDRTAGTEDYFSDIKNMTAYPGNLDPIFGDTKYNSTGLWTTAVTDFMFPYVPQDGTSVTLLVGRGGNLYEHPTSGASTTITTLVTLTNAGTTRWGAQALGYCYISGASLTLLRYCHANPGSQGKLSFAGTKAPTVAPTMTLMGSGSLTSGTGYAYRYAWEYGVTATSGRGELGMGWKQSAALVTATAVSTAISITMDASPPSSYSHVVARSLWRNTDAYPISLNTFFLVTRTAYTGSALATSYLDTASDASIELGEETDPTISQTVTAPLYSELLPPMMQFVAVHEGRLWGLDITVNGTRFPHRVVYSRIAGIGPHFDQFDLSSNILAANAEIGEPMGLIPWMGNLYAIFRRGVCFLSTDPGPGRLPAFSQVVFGRGCVNSKSISLMPEGIIYLSQEGLVLFNGGPSPLPFSERMWGVFSSRNSFAAGGYVPLLREYRVASATNVYSKCVSNDYWYTCNDNNVSWSRCCQVGDDLVYALPSDTFLYKAGAGQIGVSKDGGNLERRLTTFATHFGFPDRMKHLREISLVFSRKITPEASQSSVAVTWQTDELISTGVSQFFPSVEAKRFSFAYNPAGASFLGSEFLALTAAVSISAADDTDTTLKNAGIESMHFRFVMADDRETRKGDA